MRVVTAQTSAASALDAIEDIAQEFRQSGVENPRFLAIHFGVGMDAAQLQAAAARRFPAAALHGGSSCLGIMTQQGVGISTGNTVGVFAIEDADGSYGTASAALGDDARQAARAAVVAALEAAGRTGEIPDLVWLSVAPGREEQVLDGLRDVVGQQTLIVGGSAADNDVSGKWAVFGPSDCHSDGLVVSVLFTAAPVTSVYQSSYTPAGPSGQVTRVEGRTLIEIDGRPASEVYHEWTGGVIPQPDQVPVSILAQATRWPLGRVTRHFAGIPFHVLAHPAQALPCGGLELFADLKQGDTLWQMWGSDDNLVARAGRVAQQARSDSGQTISGALVIYCGGCLMAVRDRIEEVHAGLMASLDTVPWIGIFTFGEQGAPPGGQSEHGNLMISCTVFSA